MAESTADKLREQAGEYHMEAGVCFRDCDNRPDNGETSSAERYEFFRKRGNGTREAGVVCVNDDSVFECLRRSDESWKVRLEGDFKRLMFDVEDN